MDVAFPSSSNVLRVGVGNAEQLRALHIWWCTKEFLGRPCAADGEARAYSSCFRGVTRCKQWSRVVIEGDYLQVINITDHLLLSALLVDSCLSFYSCFFSLSFYFVKRSDNSLNYELFLFYYVLGLGGRQP